MRDRRKQVLDALAAGTPNAVASQGMLPLERRQLDVQIARREQAKKILATQSRLTVLRSKEDELYLQSLRPHVQALEKRRTGLVEARGRSRLKVLELSCSARKTRSKSRF